MSELERKSDKTILYFTATSVPTDPERVEIEMLTEDWGEVLVRRADVPEGLAEGKLEPADALAGSVPPEYIAMKHKYPYGVVTVDKPTIEKDAEDDTRKKKK